MLIIANAEKNTLAQKEKENKYEMSGYEIDMQNDNSSHTILARNALGSKKILDVGCGVGYIGRAIKKIQKCTIDGIDIDKAALEIAKGYYDGVSQMKLGDPTDQAFAAFLRDRTRYDCIICGDIIEHLVDPGYVISILAKKLTPNGKILVSIPNIAHIDVIVNLLNGRFNYGEAGILDNTHLRFWTESSFYDFIKNINEHYQVSLSVKRIAKITLEHPFINAHWLHEVCGDDIFIFQNVFELTSKKNPTFPRLQKKNNYDRIVAAIDKANSLEEQLAEKTKILQDTESSISWKITKPLRAVNAILHKH